jgi:hypothetical protein
MINYYPISSFFYFIFQMSLPLTVPQREIGKTGVKVSAVGLGCMSLVCDYGKSDQVRKGVAKAVIVFRLLAFMVRSMTVKV